MIPTRAIGLNHIYLDEHLDGFSNVAVGLLLRAVGHSLKVAYVDVTGSPKKFTNFLENLSLSSFFVRKFDRLYIETFVLRGDKVSKGIIPSVEFNTITKEIFWDEINKFDLVIFDGANLEQISNFKILNFLENKNPTTESVFIFNNKKDFDEVKENFDLISSYNYNKKSTFQSNKNIINITGDGKGKSTFSFGYIVRRFIEKKDVKLVYFDKGGNYYGERVFFDALKDWSKRNISYGKFDYVATGASRFDGYKFRFENNSKDLSEAKEGLMLFKTALKKQTPVIGEELNTTIKTGLLNLYEVLDILKEINHEVLITGRYSPKEILEISDIVIEVKEIKHYSKNNQGVRKGIDF